MNPAQQTRVRPARTADDATLAEIEAASWSAESGFPSVIHAARPGALFFTADSPPEVHLVAEVDGDVAGYIRLKPPTHLPENGHVMHVHGLAVHPSARRRGVAAALLNAAAEQSADRGSRKLSLRVLGSNEPAIRLYEKLGFVREGTLVEEFLIEGCYVDDVQMARYLVSL